MSDDFELIDGFVGADEHSWKGPRTVRWDDSEHLLVVTVTGQTWEQAHFRLVPVRQQWVEIGDDDDE